MKKLCRYYIEEIMEIFYCRNYGDILLKKLWRYFIEEIMEIFY